MNRTVLVGSLLAAFALGVACGGKSAVATMAAKSGSAVSGTATFTENGSNVDLSLRLSGVPAGQHAFHIHAVGDCSSADGLSAGGHWNPTDAGHGHLGETAASHLGDIGNVTADADGGVNFSFSTTVWKIGDSSTSDIVGKAVIVHGGVDDYATQPTGNAGNRLGCGVITLQQ